MKSPRTTFLVLAVLFLSAGLLVAQSRQKATQAETKDAAKQRQRESPASHKSSAQRSGKQKSKKQKTEQIVHTDKEWRKILTRDEFRVLRKKGTEKPFRNKYDKHFKPGTYACAACGQELFASNTKFNSGCGWPAFYASLAGDRIKMTSDFSLGMVRTEVTCTRCGSHLGHIFNDAPQTPTGQRFCINSVSLKFIPAKSNGKGAESKHPPTSKRNKPRSN